MATSTYRKVVTLSLLFAAITLTRGFAADESNCAKPVVVDDTTYKPGQVWSYKNRPGEDASTITILRVESTPKLGLIVHVRIDKFRLENCKGNTGDSTMDHAPFAKAAIDNSVVKLLRTEKDIPDFDEGYKDWLSHCGGVYKMSVAEALTLTNKTMKDHGCQDQ
jgi:hypothetical protein